MGLEKNVTQYQIDYFHQEDMLKDHSSRILNTFQSNKTDQSSAAQELAMAAAQTYMIINDVQKGVCAALCIKWIKMIAGGKRGSMAQLKNDVTFAKAVIRQQAAKERVGLQQQQLAASYKIKATHKELNFSRPLNFMVDDMLAESGLFYLVSFITQTGSHVIAVSSGDCKSPVIFDPNFGEFRVPSKDITKFITNLLSQGYSAESKKINGLSRWEFS